MTGKFEQRYPVVFSWIGGVVCAVCSRFVDLNQSVDLALLQSLISTAAILVGFLATALSVFLSISHYEVMKRISYIDHEKRLMRFILHTIYGLLAVVAISLLKIATMPSGVWNTLVIFVLGTAIGFSLLALHRLIRPIHNIMEQIYSDRDE